MNRVNTAALADRHHEGDDDVLLEFERRLRDDARRVMVSPSPQLRAWTLAVLNEQPRTMAYTTRSWARPALAACVLLTILAGIAALLLRPQPPSMSPGHAPQMVVQTHLNLILQRTDTPLGEPLLNEARLLARDAQRAFARFKVGLPSPPKFNRVENNSSSAS